MPLTVKFHLLGEDQKVKVIRKIELDIYVENTFEILLERVQDLFNLPADKISLFYKDDDGDLVMFVSDEEMRIGQRNRKADTFSVYIKGKDGTNPRSFKPTGFSH
uniref:PB1 domain-containing protein n=1 Tax=Sphaeramia orbicularis TaxID=375764 RepID=A0A672ZRJ8_9TELE